MTKTLNKYNSAFILGSIMENIENIITIKDQNLNYIACSKECMKFLKINKDDKIINKSIYEIFSPENAKIIANLSNQTLKTQKPQTCIVHHLNKILKITSTPISNNGIENGIISITKDITAEENLKNSLIEKNTRESCRELYLANLAHDLKNPLLAQITSLELISKGMFGDLTPEQSEMLDCTIESAKFMREMLRSILTSYKYENGKLILEKSYFDIKELLQHCINETKGQTCEKNIKIITTTKGLKKPELYADKTHIRRIITNLLNNSLNYAFSDSEIHIDIFSKGKNIGLSIENSSPEIPQEIRDNLFDKYFTGAQKFQDTSFGLGLSIVKQIVDAHNGRIYLEANGTRNRFTVEIPIDKKQGKPEG